MHKELERNQGLCDIQYDQLQTLMKKKSLIKCFMGQGTLEVEAGELRLQDQNLGCIVKLCLKRRNTTSGDEQRGALWEAKIPVRTEHWEH